MNGMIGCCFPWSWLTDSITWQQRRDFGNITLPEDLVLEILSRLPLTYVIRFRLVCKQWYAMTSTQSFLEMHYNNQPSQEPTFVYVVQPPDRVAGSPPAHHFGFFSINEKAAEWKKFEMETRRLELNIVDTTHHLRSREITLISLYKGFLLYKANVSSELTLIFYNPITDRVVKLISPASRYAYCGFFFHSPTKEYKVLYQVFEEDVADGFVVYGLQTRSVRKINTNFSAKHHPDSSTPAVISNGCLYWMVSETHHKNAFGVLPSCSEAILSFREENEEFHLLSHPVFHDNVAGRSSPPRHNKMHLLEMEGQLCLCNGYSLRVEIWVMEDYTKWIWVKRHVVKLDSFLPSPSSGGLTYGKEIKVVQIHQSELLLEYNTPQVGKEYFLYQSNRDLNAYRDNKNFEQHSKHIILNKNKDFQVVIERLSFVNNTLISTDDNHSSDDEEIVRRIAIKNLRPGESLSGVVVLSSHSLISLEG